MASNYEYRVPRIVLADRHPISRYGVRVALSSWHVAEVVGEASSMEELFDVLASRPCDIVLVDYTLQEKGCVRPSMIEQLVQKYPGTSIVIVTALRNAGLLDRAFADGIKGWVDKSEDRSELIAAIREVRAGRIYVGKTTRTMLKEVGIERPGCPTPLSPTEFSVLSWSIYESSNIMDIAKRLRCAYKVASRHKRCALTKLGLKNDQQLLEYCYWVDLLPCEKFKKEA